MGADFPFVSSSIMLIMQVERAGLRLEDIHPDPLVSFPAHKRDKGNDWDQWWLRHDKFARKAK